MSIYMTSPIVPILLERESPAFPWGFRLQGGADYRLHLSIKKVSPNTPAHGRLHAGDVIIAVNGQDAANWSHGQAYEAIKNSGYSLNLMVRKGQYTLIKPTRAAVKYTVTGVSQTHTIPVQNAYRRF